MNAPTEPGSTPDGRHVHALIRWLREAEILPTPTAHTPPEELARLTPASADDPRLAVYVQRAVDGELAEIAGTGPGGRNHQLNASAFKIGTMVGAGLLDHDQAREALIAAGLAAGLERRETMLTVASGLAAGKQEPRVVRLREPAPPVEFPGFDEMPRRGDPGRDDGPGGSPAGPPGGPPEDGPPGGHDRGSRRYEVGNHVEAMRWLLDEIGQRGLAGMLRRGSQIVHSARVGEQGYVEPIRKGDDNGPASLRPVTPDMLAAELATEYTIHKRTEVKPKRDKPGRPRKDEVKDEPVGKIYRETEVFFPPAAVRNALAKDLDAMPALHALYGVTHTPIVRADGSILDTPGFDEASGYLYLPTVAVPAVPECPTREQLDAAVELLALPFAKFRWVTKHDLANYLGLMLTPLLRLLTPPPYKLGAIMARQPGSGKSMLAEVLRIVHDGVFRSEMPHDDAELAKSLAGILTTTTAPVVTFDNVNGLVESSRLAGLLTERKYSDRVLGSSDNVAMLNDRVWTLTGNNMSFGTDMIRRTIWMTIDPGVPNPERRKFDLNPPRYATEHRGEMLAALLTLVRAWVADGRPGFELHASDTYATWTATVRAVLRHAGIDGEFDHPDSAQQTLGGEDDGWADLLELIRGWYGHSLFTITSLLDRAKTDAEFRQVLPDDLRKRVDNAKGDVRAIAKSLGWRFKGKQGQWANGRTIRKMPGPENAARALWRVEIAADSTPLDAWQPALGDEG